MRQGWLIEVLGGALLTFGCAVAAHDDGETTGATSCAPGETFQCPCADGSESVQLCSDDGTRLEPCACGDQPPVGTGGMPPTGTGGTPFTGTGGTAPTGTGGTPPTGTGGTPPTGTGGTPPATGGTPPIGGAGGFETFGGAGGTVSFGGAGGEAFGGAGGEAVGGAGGSGGTPITGGTCCPSGDCLCHGPDPSQLTSSSGIYDTQSFPGSTGTIYYPTDAEPPFAAIALCGGFTNTGPEMAAWGPFYASHGIVTLITTTGGLDFPDVRAGKLLASIAELKAQNGNASSPLYQQLAGRYGTSGYSMGGGGTTIASQDDPTLRTSIGLAAWSPVGTGVQVPTLFLCGSSDGTAPCSMSSGAYDDIPSGTPKMQVTISGASHLNWFGPTSAGGGVSGETALAFQKVYLEGDERWRPLLLQSDGTVKTNIQ